MDITYAMLFLFFIIGLNGDDCDDAVDVTNLMPIVLYLLAGSANERRRRNRETEQELFDDEDSLLNRFNRKK